MKLFGYLSVLKNLNISGNLLFSTPHISEDKIAEWMRLEIPNDKLTTVVELNKERLRTELLHCTTAERRNIPKEIIEGCFLFPDLFETIQGEVSDKK